MSHCRIHSCCSREHPLVELARNTGWVDVWKEETKSSRGLCMQVESCVQAAISEYLGRSWNAVLADLLSPE